MQVQGDVTHLLASWYGGDHGALQSLLPAVYDELRKTAGSIVANWSKPGFSRTELVHEVYLRLAAGRPVECHDRRHFYSLSARVMRVLLVDQARAMRAVKRNGGLRVELECVDELNPVAIEDHLALHHCLSKLEEFAPRKAQIVELRFFGGLELNEIAEFLGISLALVSRELLHARAWMARELREHGAH